MKKFLLVAGFIFPAATLSAQYVAGQSVEYTYDTAGNRILREPWNPSQGPSNKTNPFDQEVNTEPQSDDLESANINMYPNPTTGLLLIQLKGKAISDQAGQISIYSAQGDLVRNYPLEAGLDELEIDLSNLPSGMYFIQLFRESENYRKSIIKQ